jgi:hypothetical protein
VSRFRCEYRLVALVRRVESLQVTSLSEYCSSVPKHHSSGGGVEAVTVTQPPPRPSTPQCQQTCRSPLEQLQTVDEEALTLSLRTPVWNAKGNEPRLVSSPTVGEHKLTSQTVPWPEPLRKRRSIVHPLVTHQTGIWHRFRQLVY